MSKFCSRDKPATTCPLLFGKLRFVSEFLRAQPAHLNAWVKDQPRQLAVFCFVAILIRRGSLWRRDGQLSCPYRCSIPESSYRWHSADHARQWSAQRHARAAAGATVTFRQSLALVLASFAITALILGALSPVALFVI